MPKTGPKESRRTKHAIMLVGQRVPIVKAAYLAGINPSTLYRALQRRKERK